MTFYLIIGISSFLISLLGTRLTILALRKRLMFMDRPNLRSNHKIPTPRGGGIAVVFAILVGLLIAGVGYSIVIALLLLAAISMLDDLINVPAWVRLLVQIFAVSIPLSVMDPLFGGVLPGWLDKLVTGILWVWFINLFNFMDGIDGISAAEMICIGLGLCLVIAIFGVFPGDLFAYGLVVATAGFGFLWWNWHPARIFLGDVGSIPIGFIIGYLLLLAVQHGFVYAAIILPAYYLADSTITLGRRIWQKKKIWVAHSEHYYQQAVRKGHKHSSVVRYIIGINFLLIYLAVASAIESEIAIFHISMAYLSVFMLLGFFAHTKPHDDHL